MSQLESIVQKLVRAKRIVVFTGAGVSADSGIPTFREKCTGVWASHDPMKLATLDGWNANKRLVWSWYESRRLLVEQAEPNAAHHGIANLQHALESLTGESVQVDVITQNYDNLHERAGSASVLHLHGSLFTPRCIKCKALHHMSSAKDEIVDPPECVVCGGTVRPGVVWFGEQLPEADHTRAKELARLCDVMLVVGTSCLVYPASGIPMEALMSKSFVASINPEKGHNSRLHSMQWVETAGNAVTQIIQSIVSMRTSR